MFDFAWSELGLIAVVSVLVMGPKQLPETMRTMAKVMRRVRSLGAEFQGHVNEMIREAELEDLRKQVQTLSSTDVTAEVTKVVDPDGELNKSLQMEPATDTQAAPVAESVPEVQGPQAAVSQDIVPQETALQESQAPGGNPPSPAAPQDHPHPSEHGPGSAT